MFYWWHEPRVPKAVTRDLKEAAARALNSATEIYFRLKNDCLNSAIQMPQKKVFRSLTLLCSKEELEGPKNVLRTKFVSESLRTKYF